MKFPICNQESVTNRFTIKANLSDVQQQNHFQLQCIGLENEKIIVKENITVVQVFGAPCLQVGSGITNPAPPQGSLICFLKLPVVVVPQILCLLQIISKFYCSYNFFILYNI